MFYVYKNMYSHEGSGFTLQHSKHPDLTSAKEEADKLYAAKQRIVFVKDEEGKYVYNPRAKDAFSF